MRHEHSFELEAEPHAVLDILGDVEGFPDWITVCHNVEPDNAATLWLVTLRSRIGVTERMKKLRVVKTSGRDWVAYNRLERDQHQRANWAAIAYVKPTDTGSLCSCMVSYDGDHWSTVVNRLFQVAINRFSDRLKQRVMDNDST